MAREASGRDRATWSFIRYASVWEDADVLCDALAPAAAGGRLLSVASAGDNALALLTLDPAEVVAVDLNPAQLACLELRMAAFRALEHGALLAFLGVTEDRGRASTYRGLRGDLAPPAREFWDAHPDAVERGIIHTGKFERYLRAFRRFLLPLVHSRRTIERLCLPRSPEERRAFYAREWDTWRWRAVFRVFFSRAVMGRLGRDPAFFDHVGGTPVGDRILERTRYALTELPTDTNPYLVYIMTGSYAPGALPRYLRPEREHRPVEGEDPGETRGDHPPAGVYRLARPLHRGIGQLAPQLGRAEEEEEERGDQGGADGLTLEGAGGREGCEQVHHSTTSSRWKAP
ncbi:MAG TPA: DUF3419 family protein [Longimicrobiaceae bacterium]|nr:DUF3419 family protein [Longimicrobiaceae bacterium]